MFFRGSRLTARDKETIGYMFPGGTASLLNNDGSYSDEEVPVNMDRDFYVFCDPLMDYDVFRFVTVMLLLLCNF